MATSEYPQIQEKLNILPTCPGCYLYKDSAGLIIYVGKAVNLRSRVRSYFQKSANHSIKTLRLVQTIRDLDFITVETELEALVLECNLIKKHQPYYNVRLRDDKQYPYLCVTTAEPFPRLIMTRRVKQDGNRYFGPYTSSRTVFSTIDLLKRIFPIVSCGKSFTGEAVQKPCLYHHLGQCLAPCAGLADKKEYKVAVDNIVSFLEGRQENIVRDLKKRMDSSAESLQFERAAKYRDQYKAVEEVMTRQKIISSRIIDQDVVAMVAGDDGACVQMFYIRGGKLMGQNTFMMEGGKDDGPAEAVEQFVKQYYQTAPFIPREILLPCDIAETAIVQQWLRQKRGSVVDITVPVRGDKKRLVEMAQENAGFAFERIKAEMRAKLGNRQKALAELGSALGLEGMPLRIECYDISNFQNDHFVGSMVVCEKGEMAKEEYRRFKIKFHENKPDDFAMIREVLTRRLQEYKAGHAKFSRLPNLIIVDGGKGQVSAAVMAIEGVGFAIQGQPTAPGEPTVQVLPLCGLAKRFELLILPNKSEPIALPRDSQALYLVQRIRDEAHRFANAYRVILQSKKQTRSTLDLVQGIGPTRRKALLKAFGTLENIRKATIEEMCSVKGLTRASAEAVKEYLVKG